MIDLFIERSESASTPHWQIAQDQEPPSESEWRDKVQDLALQHPTMSQRQMAEELGCSPGTLNKYQPGKKAVP